MEGGAGASGEPSHAPLLESTRPPYDVEEGRQGGEESTCWAWARKIHRNPDNDIVNTNFTTVMFLCGPLHPVHVQGWGHPRMACAPDSELAPRTGVRCVEHYMRSKNADTNFGHQNSLEAV